MAKDYTTSVVVKRDNSERLPQRKDPVYKQFIREIGGRAGLRELALASANPKATQLLELLEDDVYKFWGVKKLLQASSISFNEALQLRDERSRNLAVSSMIAGLPGLADDLVEDARTVRMLCPVCSGNKTIIHKSKEGNEYATLCEGCGGFGELVRRGDKDARQLVAKATKIVDNGPGIVVDARTQVNNVVNNPLGNSFEEIMRKAGKVIQLLPVKATDESGSVEGELI